MVEISAFGPDKQERLFPRLALLAVIVGIFFLFSPGGKGAFGADQAATITYPVKTFQDGNARFYEYKTKDGITIKYFILKSQDGVIRAAFDACDVCWAEGKGYYQKGDIMVCRNCGRRFASNRVNDVSGGCNPAPLNREIVGEKLVIKVPDILAGRKYFDFARRGQK
ncbi:MAG: DUF2318 domain-containing protein [Deltaproteobacteria bacterium]|nr:DUF2318 domain-containing protein [Deltaproteobacteria bacterium]